MLFVGCRSAVAGPDDEQVLVQRAAVVQQGQELNIDSEAARKAFAEKMYQLVGNLTANISRPDGASKNNTFGTEGAMCTDDEVKGFEDAMKFYAQAKKDGGIALAKHVYNHSVAVLEKMFQPLLAAGKAVLNASETKFKPPMRTLLKYYLVQAFVKPDVQYNVSELFRPDLAAKLAENIIKWNSGDWTKMISKSWTEFDALLNRTAQKLPILAELEVPMGVAPVIHWNRSTSNLLEYFASKAMPIIGVEIFPRIVEPLKLLSKVPRKPEDFFLFVMDEVQPVVAPFLKNVSDDVAPFFPSESVLPKRLCQTCQERYNEDISTIASGGCSSFCFEFMASCSRGIGMDCVMSAHSCVACHSDKLASFDLCTGKATHAKSIATLTAVSKYLANATDDPGFDAFIDKAAEMILKG